MSSLILSVSTRLLLPLMSLFSVFILLRGHDEPGGGFIGGLVVSAALTLYAVAEGVERARDAVRLDTIYYIAIGLALALGSGSLPLLYGLPFLTILWFPMQLSGMGKLGTAFTFDVGVYLLVMGVTLTIIFSMADEEER